METVVGRSRRYATILITCRNVPSMAHAAVMLRKRPVFQVFDPQECEIRALKCATLSATSSLIL